MKHWRNKPMVFQKSSLLDFYGHKFPHTVDKDLGNGLVVGRIIEEDLTTVQKVLLSTL